MAERARTSAGGRRKTTRSSRGATSIPIDDEQLVEENELTDLPHARVAIHEASAGALAQARATIAAWGYEIVVAGAGAPGAAEVIARLTGDPPPDVVVVGLPGGEAVLDAARALEPRRPALIAAVPGTGRVAADRAHAAGADLVALRPHEPERLGPVLFAAAKLAAERQELLTLRGNEVRLRERLSRYGRADTATGFQQFEFFQRVLELEIKRARRHGYALSVCLLRHVEPPRLAATVQRDLRVRAATAVASAIRDIDMPVEIAGDRFLLLLPYTDPEAAAQVAQRIVAAVAKAPPVRAASGPVTARVLAGVSGVASGGELSFARLMRDATTALKAAEAEGEDVMIA
ncbi:MAG TPA: GGDEF domain-containing protein [Kofleriaceae bacterium]|jgi:GGDEF domain-containing protein|nr:GGDEF domain-containing protein [Kofleriaceae bacterium]